MPEHFFIYGGLYRASNVEVFAMVRVRIPAARNQSPIKLQKMMIIR